MEYIIIDLEFNQPFNFPTGKKYKVVPLCPFEIIQIGAVKVNHNFEVIDTFNSFVSPVIYPRIHPFVEKITGINKKDLHDQPKFEEVYNDFIKFLGRSDYIFCIWGNDDLKFLFRNILFHKLDYEYISKKYVNVQAYASKYLSIDNGQAVGLKTAVTELGLEPDLSFHNALNDALYTTKIFNIVKPENFIPTTISPEKLLTSTTTNNKNKIKIKDLYTHICDLVGKEELTPEERKITRLAYIAGREKSFDISNTEKNNNYRKKNNNKNNNNNS